MEKLTNLLNTSNCYRQILKEHSKSMYNQLKFLTAAELEKRNSQLNKQIVRVIFYFYIIYKYPLIYEEYKYLVYRIIYPMNELQ